MRQERKREGKVRKEEEKKKRTKKEAKEEIEIRRNEVEKGVGLHRASLGSAKIFFKT